MNWFENLLFDPDSIAHIVLLYSVVIAAGIFLGKIKVFGISLGVTFVLFAGIVAGHFGFTGNLSVLKESSINSIYPLVSDSRTL